MTASSFAHNLSLTGAARGRMPATSGPLTCAVRLIDRRTGQTHRINGRPLVLVTRNPDAAVAGLLEGRDAAVWEARVEHLGRAVRR